MALPEAYILPGWLRAPMHLEVAVDVEPAHRVAAGAAVVQQVGQHAVLADVGLQPGAVDDEVARYDLDRGSLSPVFR